MTKKKASDAISIENLEKLKVLVKADNDNRMLTLIGFASLTLRIGDILNLKVSDVYSLDGSPRDLIKLVEQKTGKTRLIPITKIHELLIEHKIELNKMNIKRDQVMFYSRKTKTPIRVQSVNRILKKYAEILNIRISCHSFRKGTVRHLVNSGQIEMHTAQAMLAHSSIAVTYIYLDMNRKDVDLAFAKIAV